MAQAQCQKDLKGLSKKIESKQGDLEAAQQELQQQQKTEAVMQKRISEAERRLQVHDASCFALHVSLHRTCWTGQMPAQSQPII